MKNRYKIKKWYELDNRWVKIIYTSRRNKVGTLVWYMTVIAGKTKRECNDTYTKGLKSPKSKYGQSTGGNNGIKILSIALKDLLEFETTLIKGMEIDIIPFCERLEKPYSRLERYGYIKTETKNKKICNYYYKKVIE